MAAVPLSRPTIWLRTAPPAPVGRRPPRCAGPQDLLDRVLVALRGVRDVDGQTDIVASGRVIALTIDDDEAVLTLGLGGGPCHGDHAIAEEAFSVLREGLPGRDLYLRPAGADASERAVEPR